MIADIDALFRSSLSSLVEDIAGSNWTGRRERELVNLFVFGHLLPQCRPGSFLHDAAQIGIEMAVPQVAKQIALSGRSMSKSQVCKDVVLWPRPRMTCWDASGKPTVRPASIVEWKHNHGDISAYDVEWLRQFSLGVGDFVGYAVCTNFDDAKSFRLSCVRVHMGVQTLWLCLR